MDKQLITVSDEDLIKAMELRTIGRKVKELLAYFKWRKEDLMDIRTVELSGLTEEQVRYFGKFRDTALEAVNILQQMEKSKQSEEIIKHINNLYDNRNIMMEEPKNEQ